MISHFARSFCSRIWNSSREQYAARHLPHRIHKPIIYENMSLWRASRIWRRGWGHLPKRRVVMLSVTQCQVCNLILVWYSCKSGWTLTNRDEQHLRIFERRILRKILGPVQNEDGSWRIRMNYELNELIGNADIVRFIKSRRIAWLVTWCGWMTREHLREYYSGNL